MAGPYTRKPISPAAGACRLLRAEAVSSFGRNCWIYLLATAHRNVADGIDPQIALVRGDCPHPMADKGPGLLHAMLPNVVATAHSWSECKHQRIFENVPFPVPKNFFFRTIA